MSNWKYTRKFTNTCTTCGRDYMGNNNSSLCYYCRCKLRVMSPILSEEEREAITADQFNDYVKKAGEYRESLREKYGWADAVFEVKEVYSEPGGFLSPPIVNAAGHVLFGNFNYSDKIRIVSGGSSREEEICYIFIFNERYVKHNVKDIKKDIKGCKAHIPAMNEGENCVISFFSKNTDLKPGDLIVKGGRQ